MKKGVAIAFIICSLLFAGVFSSLPAQANWKPAPLPHILIRADGSVDPASERINRNVDVYTLTGNLSGAVLDIQRSNAVFNGAGFSIPGIGFDYAILLTGVTNVTVANFTIIDRNVAIHLNASSYCTITGNRITDASEGIWLTDYSDRNTISVNSMYSCYFGVHFDHSRNNVLRNNSAIGDALPSSQPIDPMFKEWIIGENYAVTGDVLEDFINDIDTSNSVNGKTVYYWVNQQNAEVPPDAGCVILVNCRGITVRNQHLLQNKCGILLAWTTASTVVGNIIEGNAVGVYLLESSGNTVANNSVFSNHGVDNNEGHGIRVQSSFNNVISDNRINDNYEAGICVSQSPGTKLIDNNLANNTKQNILIINKSNQFAVFRNILSGRSGVALRVADCSDGIIVGNSITNDRYYAIYLTGRVEGNGIYGNSFNGDTGNNSRLAFVNATGANPMWDNGTIGNYWKAYLTLYPNASETGATGIGDAPFVINSDNIDHLPLMSPLDPLKISAPEIVSSPCSEQDQEGNNNYGRPWDTYVLLVAGFVIAVAVAVTAVMLRRNSRLQKNLHQTLDNYSSMIRASTVFAPFS